MATPPNNIPPTPPTITAQWLEDHDKALWKNHKKIWKYENIDQDVQDGIQDYESYLCSKFRVLFILKDTNGIWGLRNFLRQGAPRGYKTWNNVTLWTQGILDGTSWLNVKKKVEEKDRKKHLARVAAINIKKIPGGTSAINKDLWEAGKSDQDFLRNQVGLYNPHLVVVCGSPTDEIVCKFIKNKYDKNVNNFWGERQLDAEYIFLKHPAIIQKRMILYEEMMEKVEPLRPLLP
jgi:hypothetical protein